MLDETLTRRLPYAGSATVVRPPVLPTGIPAVVVERRAAGRTQHLAPGVHRVPADKSCQHVVMAARRHAGPIFSNGKLATTAT